jgi:hypothetical protein
MIHTPFKNHSFAHLIVKCRAVDAFAARPIAFGEVTPLAHEPGDDAVKLRGKSRRLCQFLRKKARETQGELAGDPLNVN